MIGKTAAGGLREAMRLGTLPDSQRAPIANPTDRPSPPPLEIPASLIERLRERVENLQMLPAVAMQALELAKDPDCPISRFSSMVERDLKLAADMLRIANSTAFCSGTAVASLHQAVVRLGLRQCRELILTSSFDSLARRLSREDQSLRDLFARHGFLTAIVALRLNHLLHLGFQGEEFTAGLMHDLGRILLSVAVPETFRMHLPRDLDESNGLEEREREIFGASHADFGAWFATENRLPESLIAAIRFHHSPQSADQHRRIVATTAAASHLAAFVQRQDGPAYDPTQNCGIQELERNGISGACAKFAAAAEILLFECPRVAEAMMRD